jgi:hypothetical protein
VPPGTPAPLRAAINAAQRVLSQQYALFGRLADEARHALPPLPELSTGSIESSVIAPALALLREQDKAIYTIDTQISALATARVRAISSWGTRQIAAIVSELNQKFAAITAAGGAHAHTHHRGGHGSHPPTFPWETQSRMLDDLDHALSAAWQVVQHALDAANHVSGQVTHHSHHMRRHSTTAPAAPSVDVNLYRQTAPTTNSPDPLDLPATNVSPLPANLPSG